MRSLNSRGRGMIGEVAKRGGWNAGAGIASVPRVGRVAGDGRRVSCVEDWLVDGLAGLI